jgi:disulfide bond formation protein DsbB
MTITTFSLFFAILSLVSLAGACGLTVLLVLDRARGTEAVARFRRDLSVVALPVAWIVATVTTFGSLYYSEIAHFTPCKLCWYQRIAMYPLVLLLGIAAWRRDRNVRIYVIAQCAVGAVISIYHSYIQAFPPDNGTSFCTADAPCTERYVWEFGFVSIPFMAFTAFVFIITLMLVARPDPDHIDDLAPGAPA